MPYESLVESCVDGIGGKARARDLTHDVADDHILLRTNEGRGVGGVGLLAVAFGSVCLNTDVAGSIYAKDAPMFAELYLWIFP